MSTPLKPLAESEYWDEQCAAYPFLADDFDAAKLRVPVLRNTLGTLNIDFPNNARKAELVQLFRDHSAGPISAFREYVRKGYADFADREEKRKRKDAKITKTKLKNTGKTPAILVDTQSPIVEEPPTPNPEDTAAHHTRLWTPEALGPYKQERLSELYGSLLPLAGVDPRSHAGDLHWPVEDVVRVLGSAPFERRFKAISAMLDLERERRERGEEPETPAPGGSGGSDAGFSSRGQKRGRREAVLQAAKRVKVSRDEDAAFRKLLQQSRTRAFERLETDAMGFETARKACLAELEIMTLAVDEMRKSWTLLRNAGPDVEELFEEFSQVEG